MTAAPPSTLQRAGIYRRTVRAPIARVWENVFDWEHLPALHEDDFHAADLIERGPKGWKVSLVNQPGDKSRAQIIELRADKAAGRYRVVTLAGPGAGSEIRTSLTPKTSNRTGVEVEFFVPGGERDVSSVGRRYVETYTRLWDQDEAMMVRRERLLASRRRPRAKNPRSKLLGPIEDIRVRLPLVVGFGGERFRLVELDGEFVAHAITCPHWLGPLEETDVVDGCVRCPWHGYRFDVRTGASSDGRNLSLPQPPRITIADGQVRLTSCSKS